MGEDVEAAFSHGGHDLCGHVGRIHTRLDEAANEIAEHRGHGRITVVDGLRRRDLASPMLVRTQPGHNTDTPTPGASMAASWKAASEIATTPNLLTSYGPMKGGANNPATDAVLTT